MRGRLPVSGQVSGYGRALAFADPSTGYLLLGDGGAATLFLTTDGGRSWSGVSGPASATQISISGDQVWVLAANGFAAAADGRWLLDCQLDGGMNQGDVELYASTDGGRHWTLTAAGRVQGPDVGLISDTMTGPLVASGDGTLPWRAGNVASRRARHESRRRDRSGPGPRAAPQDRRARRREADRPGSRGG